MYTAITHDIKVDVQPVYIENKSNPVARRHVFVYHIQIHNQSDQPVNLKSRFWNIQDDYGENHQVEGKGVIGKQPEIEPGDTFYYNSFTVLKSFKGSMEGYYTMEQEDGNQFKVAIPRFNLVSHLLN